jgi:hypothetical protein
LLDAGTLMKCDGVKPVLIGSKSDVNDLSSTANVSSCSQSSMQFIQCVLDHEAY